MTEQSDLFGSGPGAPVDVAPGAARWGGLAARLPAGIRLGTSSWSFPGWKGLVYDRRAGTAVLSRHGLSAYARHPLFGAVGFDRAYYDAPPVAVHRHHASQVPADFRFMVKAQRDLMTPGHPRFLDAMWAREAVIDPAAEGLGDRLGVVLFQFTPIDPRSVGGARPFAERLYRFLRQLASPVPVAVEVRTPALVTPDYRQALEHGGAAHGYVVHPAMLTLEEQVQAIPVRPGSPVLVRWMLAPGATYAAARDAWAPFAAMQRPDPSNRAAVAELVHRAVQAAVPAMVIVNNKAEGCSPQSVEALAEAIVAAGVAGRT